MKTSWSITSDFENKKRKKEIWKTGKTRFDVDVKFGKEVKIFSLKVNEVENYTASVKGLKSAGRKLFGSNKLHRIEKCLVCSRSSKDAELVFVVYGANYVQCRQCSHVFLKRALTPGALKAYYTKDKRYQKNYAEVRNSKIRVEQVAKPKALWAVEQFSNSFGRKPKKILDVGAGSGHFVKACRDLGIAADGLEISETGRNFALDFFNIEMIGGDFLKDWRNFADYDIVTFWGVIEHVLNPIDFIKTAKKVLRRNKGLIVSEVPRWSSFSTSVQQIYNKSIVRHLDPFGHISCFTDASVADLYLRGGLKVTGAWYYGMDAYELIMQLAYVQKDHRLIAASAKNFNHLQSSLDLARLSDQVAIAGIS